MKAILPLAVCYENGCRVCPRPDGWQGLARGSHSSTSLKASRSSVAGTKPPKQARVSLVLVGLPLVLEQEMKAERARLRVNAVL